VRARDTTAQLLRKNPKPSRRFRASALAAAAAAHSLNEAGEGDDMISDWTEVAETFDAMGLHENLLRGIYAYGASSPLALPPPASDSAPPRATVCATATRSRSARWVMPPGAWSVRIGVRS
jgi:hypothetical protein